MTRRSRWTAPLLLSAALFALTAAADPAQPTSTNSGAAMSRVMIVLYVADQDRAKTFYRAVLGTEPKLDVPGMTEFPLTDSASLGLMPETGARELLGDKVPDPATGAGVPRAELYLFVADPDAAYGRLLKAGGTAVSPPETKPWGDRVAYGLDPDGHVVALAKKTGRAE